MNKIDLQAHIRDRRAHGGGRTDQVNINVASIPIRGQSFVWLFRLVWIYDFSLGMQGHSSSVSIYIITPSGLDVVYETVQELSNGFYYVTIPATFTNYDWFVLFTYSSACLPAVGVFYPVSSA